MGFYVAGIGLDTMKPRANWKGFLQVSALSCPVALYTAASTSERIAFSTINRASGHRVRREFVDSVTGKPVDKEEQVKGYEVEKDHYVLLEPEEIAEAHAESDKTLAVTAFIPLAGIDEVFFDKPYYLAPADASGADAFNVIREGLEQRKAVAIARAVLFRRPRTLVISAYGAGLMATTLHFDYEVRASGEAFDAVPDLRIKGEMLDLAKHIITTKQGVFDPCEHEDRYEAALAELVKAKMEGRALVAPKKQRAGKTINLLQALRDSAGARVAGRRRTKTSKQAAKTPTESRRAQKPRTPRRKAS
jgi:DNA end-binding protein Ku